MSHATVWTCRSCRVVLGQVRDGVLLPLVPVESVDAGGAARVPCPRCGRVRVWLPTDPSPTGMAGLSRRLLEMGGAGQGTPNRRRRSARSPIG